MVGLFQALHENTGKCLLLHWKPGRLGLKTPFRSVLEVNCRKSQIPHGKNKCKIVCLLGRWSHSNEELKLWNFSSLHWKEDRRRRSVVNRQESLPISGLSRWLHGKESACSAGDAGDTGLNPGSGRSTERGNVSPLQYSCLDTPMDRGLQSMGSQRVWQDWAHTHTTPNSR